MKVEEKVEGSGIRETYLNRILGKKYFLDLPYTHGFFSVSLLESWPLAGRHEMGGQRSNGGVEQLRRLSSAHDCPGTSRRELSKHRARVWK